MSLSFGIRVTPKEFFWAVLEGEFSNPSLVTMDKRKCPKTLQSFKRGEIHSWFYDELTDLIDNRFPELSKIVIKKNQQNQRGKSELRADLEGIVFLVGGQRKILVFREAEPTLGKEIFGPGNSKKIKDFEPPFINSFADLKKEKQEAIFCAWRGLKV